MMITNKKIFILAPSYYGIDKSIYQAFKSLGFDVVLKNMRDFYFIEYLMIKITKFLPFLESGLRPWLKLFLDRDNSEYISEIKKAKPDILFIIKGHMVFPETIKIIKNDMKIPCIGYIWDCPFSSYSGRFIDDYRRTNFAKGMSFYDHIFVYDPYYVEEIKKKGVSQASYLPLATNPEQYKRLDVSRDEGQTYGFDICFVGAPSSNRMEVLDSLRDFNLGIFGDGWKRRYLSLFRKVPSYYKGKATGEKVLKVYNSSKIVLNIHGPEATYGVNTRTFDILACGAFQLVDFKSELKNLFKIDQEMVYYKDINDLKRLIRYYLENPEERRAIAEKGMARTINNHTWAHRAKEVVDVLMERQLI